MPQRIPPFTDIHCHLIPAVDDGPQTWAETLAMARIAVADGTQTIVVTPHQLGPFPQNTGERIRGATRQLADFLRSHDVPLHVLPGADVRVDAEMVRKIQSGEVLSLGDHRKHVLLELPHELYFPLQPLLHELQRAGLQGILSHPERNAGLLARPAIISELVVDGCLMQITAGSIVGTFGPACQELCRWMLQRGLVHFVASDAHGATVRRPLLDRAYACVEQLVGTEVACELFCLHPAAVAQAAEVPSGRRLPPKRGIRRWLRLAAAG